MTDKTHDELPEPVRSAASAYHHPPAVDDADLDAMWNAIEPQAFPHRFRSPSIDRASRIAPRFSTRSLLPLAAALIVGVAIGRVAPRRPPAPVQAVAAGPSADSVTLSEPYQTTTSLYLGQTAALLAALPAEVKAGRADDRFIGRAHDLLLTTRLLLDSPAAQDTRLRVLLEDLELVLAQVVRLQTDQRPAELDIIRQALEQRDVLPRLRTAAADISADD